MKQVEVFVNGELVAPGDFAVLLRGEDGKFPDVLKNHPPLYEIHAVAASALETLGVELRKVPTSYIVHAVINGIDNP